MARCNSPTAMLIDLPPLIMTGFPIVPKLPSEFAKCNGCTFSWSRVQLEACGTLELSERTKNVDYNEVSKSFVYTPTLDDIGCHLKFCAVSGQAEGCIETISKVEVTSGPGSCPFEKRHKYTSNLTENGVFRIMSYNILAEMYLNRDYLTEFQYCPRYAVELAYRTPLLLKEILGYNNDILCLQEVGRELFRDDLLPSLEAFDFEGHYREKGGGTAEGTAIFFRKSKFRYLGQHDILIIDHLETDAGCVDILQKTYSNGNFKEAFKRNFQTVQVSLPQLFLMDLQEMLYCFGSLVVRASAPEARGRGFNPRPSHTKRLTKMALAAASLDA
ncbi:hypothetical protein ACJMK2_014205 [Sinanodonta woodiana]|uniref:Uncharacterized protein n=1 Tax=Sinanodonta woodiana TaxID=1069815 RepID=A0ABD3V1Y8_SINWO